MLTFKYIENKYIPTVNLETVSKTFDTLEQGHQDAVKAKTAIDLELAKLDLNEKDEWYRREYANKIQATMDANTRYGNAYAALDNLTNMVGSLALDEGLRGRLESQKNYKQFLTDLNKAPIEEGMKQMYKEKAENQYHYEDGAVDPNTGKVTLGKLWEAGSKPVNQIDFYKVMSTALAHAAKEAGGGEQISFLDENGNETFDASKSFDGTMYMKKGTKYERLSEDKIKSAIDAAIKSTAGAEDSLKQDYEYATWKYNKAVEQARQNGEDTTPVMDGYTDKYGRIYDYNQWLDAKINPFAKAAAYNNVTTSVDLGEAYKNYRTRQFAAAGIDPNTGQPITTSDGNLSVGAGIAGSIDVETNPLDNIMSNENSANQVGLSLLKKYGGQKEFQGYDSLNDLMLYYQKAKGKGKWTVSGLASWFIKAHPEMTNDEKIAFTNALQSYRMNQKAKADIMKNMSDEDKQAIEFNSDMNNQNYIGNNQYSKQIRSYLNRIKQREIKPSLHMGREVYKTLCKKYGVTDLSDIGLNYIIDENNNYVIDFNDSKNDLQLLPKLAYLSNIANDEVGGNFRGWLTNRFTDHAASTNMQWQNMPDVYYGSDYNPSFEKKIRENYKAGKSGAEKALTKSGISRGKVTITSSDFSSLGEAEARKELSLGHITTDEYKNRKAIADKRLVDLLASGRADFGQFYVTDAEGNTVSDYGSAIELNTEIQKAAASGKITHKVTTANGIKSLDGKGFSTGYWLTIVPTTGKYKDQVLNIFTSKTIDEGVRYDPQINPDIVAENLIMQSRATGSGFEVNGYNNKIGSTNVVYAGNNTYNVQFMGRSKNLNEANTKEYVKYMYMLENIRSNYLAGVYQNEQLFVNSVNNLAMAIQHLVGGDISTVQQGVVNYITTED